MLKTCHFKATLPVTHEYSPFWAKQFQDGQFEAEEWRRQGCAPVTEPIMSRVGNPVT